MKKIDNEFKWVLNVEENDFAQFEKEDEAFVFGHAYIGAICFEILKEDDEWFYEVYVLDENATYGRTAKGKSYDHVDGASVTESKFGIEVPTKKDFDGFVKNLKKVTEPAFLKFIREHKLFYKSSYSLEEKANKKTVIW